MNSEKALGLIPRRLAIYAIGVLAALALAITLVMTAGAQPTTPVPATSSAHTGTSHVKPTIVLVHGAWADGSSWSRVVWRLQRQGYTVHATANPLRSLSGDSAYLADYLATIPGPIVLVGHSYGGAVITNAATGNANVKALVYINAFAPDQGEAAVQLAGAGSVLAGDPATVFDFAPYPGAPPGDVDLYVKTSVFPGAFANDLPAKKAAVLAATQRPLTFSAATAPSGAPAWKTIPSWYLVGTLDKVITPDAQHFMAQRAGATTVEARASHLSMISHPSAVTRLIITAAESVH